MLPELVDSGTGAGPCIPSPNGRGLLALKGKFGDKRVILAHAAPAIISKELAEAVAERLAENQAKSARNNKYPEIALLRGGFAKCGLCGANMVVSWAGRRKRPVAIYKCGRAHHNTTACRGVIMNVDKLDKAVWHEIMTRLRDPDVLRAEIDKRKAAGGKSDAITA